MFKSVKGKTWNPVKGCRHGCVYCWARYRAEDNLFRLDKYQDGFAPGFFPAEMDRKFKPGEFIFVTDMGDLLGDWVPDDWICEVLRVIRKFPETDFLLLTKNPSRFVMFQIPPNAYIGTTLETNRDYGVSKAPVPHLRFLALSSHPHPRKFISIEPIMDFDLGTMLSWVRDIKPEIVEVGADNYRHNLPEPDPQKVKTLIIGLEAEVPTVHLKNSMKRLQQSH